MLNATEEVVAVNAYDADTDCTGGAQDALAANDDVRE